MITSAYRLTARHLFSAMIRAGDVKTNQVSAFPPPPRWENITILHSTTRERGFRVIVHR